MYGYSCSTGNPCTTPDGTYASLGYAGKADNLVARRWRVDRVVDTNGNYMEYSYFETHPPSNLPVPAHDLSSYGATISYTGSDVNGTQPGYQVRFVLGNRNQIGDVPTSFNAWDLVDTQYLDRIEIYCLVCNIDPPDVPVRVYDLNYSLDPAPNANGTMVLSSLSITGGGFSENGVMVPSTSAATVRFTYIDKPNRASGNGDVFNYPRLAQIENGYGGKITYTYETDGRDNTSWYNFRVKKADVESGLGKAASRSYAYLTPAYNTLWNSPNKGGLVGYATVTETSLDYNNADAHILDTTHKFGTSDPDIGRELSTEVSTGTDPNKTIWKKIINTYITDNTKATSPAWNYRYLAKVESYLRSSGDALNDPTLTSIATYYNDPATGNLLLQSEYQGSSLYRKTYYEYSTNTDPAVYILNKVSRKLLVDAENQIYSDAYYFYDDMESNTLVSKGNLVLTQTRTDGEMDVTNAETLYDDYGSPEETRLYKSFGNLGSDPDGEYQWTTTVYDPTFHTYPITQTNALNEVYQYILSEQPGSAIPGYRRE